MKTRVFKTYKSLAACVGLIILYLAIVLVLPGRFERILQNIILLFKQNFLGLFGRNQ